MLTTLEYDGLSFVIYLVSLVVVRRVRDALAGVGHKSSCQRRPRRGVHASDLPIVKRDSDSGLLPSLLQVTTVDEQKCSFWIGET